jgi:hypothetical protein
MILEVIHLPSSKNYSTHVRDSYTDHCTTDSYIYSYAYAYTDSALHQAPPKATTISWTFHQKAAVVCKRSTRELQSMMCNNGVWSVSIFFFFFFCCCCFFLFFLFESYEGGGGEEEKNWSKICEVAEDWGGMNLEQTCSISLI